MSFFTSSSSRPSFFGLGHKPTPPSPSPSSASFSIENENIPQNENYFSFGKFSFSSFGNTNFTTTADTIPEDEEKMELVDENKGDNVEEENKAIIEEEEVHSPSQIEERECNDAESETGNGSVAEKSVDQMTHSERKVSDDGFCIPVGEPKRVRFSAPKLLKVPLKLVSPTNTRLSPKPTVQSPEPKYEEENDALETNTSKESLESDSISEKISFNDRGYEEKTLQDSPIEPRKFYESTIQKKPKPLGLEPSLPQFDESCEVLVDKVIQIEKLIDNGTKLSGEVQDKLDSSISELLDNKYR